MPHCMNFRAVGYRFPSDFVSGGASILVITSAGLGYSILWIGRPTGARVYVLK